MNLFRFQFHKFMMSLIMIILSEQGDFWKLYGWKTPIWQQTGLGNESQVLKNLHILRVSKFVMYGYEGKTEFLYL